MANGQQSGNGTSRIARVKKRKWGYDPKQVDEFLDQTHARYDNDDPELTQSVIQNVSFDLVKGGYVISQVDATLERLERAVVDKQTIEDIQRSGRVAWKAQADQLYRELAAHASRAPRERFAPGEGKAPSYDRKQVDTVVDNIIEKAGLDLKIAAGIDVDADDVNALEDVTSTAVSNTVFTQRKGKKGYDERQVDYYLNACVSLLSQLESYARIAEYEGEDSTVAAPMVANPAVAQSPATQPLFDAATVVESQAPLAAGSSSSYESASLAAQTTSTADAYAGTTGDESFDDVSRAEQAIFDQSTVPTVPATTAAATPVSVADNAATGYAGLAGLAAATAATTATDQDSSAQDDADDNAATAAFTPFSSDDMPPSFAPASSHHSSATSAASVMPTFGSDVDGIPAAASAPSATEPHKPAIADIPHITPAPRTVYPTATAATTATATSQFDSSTTPSASASASSSYVSPFSTFPSSSSHDATDTPSEVTPVSNVHLDALSSMAASIGSTPSPKSEAYESTANYQLPPLPSLDSLSIPDLPQFHRTDTDASSTVNGTSSTPSTTASSTAAASSTASSGTSHAKHAASSAPSPTSFSELKDSMGSSQLDVDIPDLSFPSFDNDTDGSGKARL